MVLCVRVCNPSCLIPMFNFLHVYMCTIAFTLPLPKQDKINYFKCLSSSLASKYKCNIKYMYCESIRYWVYKVEFQLDTSCLVGGFTLKLKYTVPVEACDVRLITHVNIRRFWSFSATYYQAFSNSINFGQHWDDDVSLSRSIEDWICGLVW